jgi:hypothetical protein
MTSSCFVLTYHVVAHYWERYDLDGSASVDLNENLPSSMIMYNRWTESVDIDETDMTRRTRDGKFMIRSNNDAGYMADQLRSQLAVIGVPEVLLRGPGRVALRRGVAGARLVGPEHVRHRSCISLIHPAVCSG